MGSFPFSSGQTYTRELTKKQEGKLLTGDFLVDLLNLGEEVLSQNQSRGSGRMGRGRAACRGRVV